MRIAALFTRSFRFSGSSTLTFPPKPSILFTRISSSGKVSVAVNLLPLGSILSMPIQSSTSVNALFSISSVTSTDCPSICTKSRSMSSRVNSRFLNFAPVKIADFILPILKVRNLFLVWQYAHTYYTFCLNMRTCGSITRLECSPSRDM